MTRLIFAIHVRVAFFSALMTTAYNFLCYLFPEPVVKNKIFALEFIFQTLQFDLPRVFDNSAFEMKNFCKTIV